MNIKNLKIGLLAIAVMFLASCASQRASTPSITHDGLVLLPDTNFAEVYEKPGAVISNYEAFIIIPCEVAFRRNWLRDQNTIKTDTSKRITQKDVDLIRTQLGTLCTQYFKTALSKDPAYPLVKTIEGDQQILELKPEIIDLDISAPDLMKPGMTRVYATSAGEMTLLLELVDATTKEVLYRIVDRRRALGAGSTTLTWTTSVTNQQEAERILMRWAQLLRDGLDQVRAE